MGPVDTLSDGCEPESTSIPLTEAFDRLIAGKTFSRSGQLKRLLVYLRDAAEAGDAAAWSEVSIGVNVLGRKDFNPKLDTIVRVEIRRLRQKLDEFYSTEGADLPLRLRLEKNSYKPYVEPNTTLAVEAITQSIVVPAVETPTVLPTDRFWTGAAYGAGTLILLALVGVLIWWAVAASATRTSREVGESPIWSGFHNSNVVVALGSPLVFRSGDGFERDFRINVPEDLHEADRLLVRRPANPLWNFWAPFDDVDAIVKLDRFLRDLNSTVTIVSARQLSFGGLAGQHTIVVGAARTAPLLVDLLRDQDFRPPAHTAGYNFAGIVNTNPKSGEPRVVSLGSGNSPHAEFGMAERDESSPDYALVTSIQVEKGGEVLSVFGDRAPTDAFVIRKLIDPTFASELDSRVFGTTKSTHLSAQIMYRVDYNRGVPTGLVYVTHRIRPANKK